MYAIQRISVFFMMTFLIIATFQDQRLRGLSKQPKAVLLWSQDIEGMIPKVPSHEHGPDDLNRKPVSPQYPGGFIT